MRAEVMPDGAAAKSGSKIPIRALSVLKTLSLFRHGRYIRAKLSDKTTKSYEGQNTKTSMGLSNPKCVDLAYGLCEFEKLCLRGHPRNSVSIGTLPACRFNELRGGCGLKPSAYPRPTAGAKKPFAGLFRFSEWQIGRAIY
jgi:hypothetical protein